MKRLVLTFALLLVGCGADSGPPSTSSEDLGSDIAALPDTPADTVPDVDSDPDRIDADPDCSTLGCPCETDGDCASGYCIGGPIEGWVCSEFCSGECSLPGYECRILVNSGGDAVELCVPSATSYCTPCTVSTDCPRLDDVCLAFDDGSFCAPDCTALQLCPVGAECAPIAEAPDAGSYCQPAEGVCQGCVDLDEDGYGRGPGCDGTDCDDTDPDVNLGAPEVCNGVDDDCDDDVDEALLTNECGGCNELDATVGAGCGTCGLGVWICDLDAITCAHDPGDLALNVCGGCDVLDGTPGESCGTCGSGFVTCVTENLTTCAGDLGDRALNACGGCAELPGTPGDECPSCAAHALECVGTDALACEPSDCCSGDTESDTCGRCGTTGRECTDGTWDEWLTCSEPECCPGDAGSRPCGRCGEQTRSCSGGSWSEWTACREPECCSGASEERACGVAGSQSRTCMAERWGDWSTCLEPGACLDGDTEADDCGCGTRTRTCVGDAWGPWSSCDGLYCCPGDTQTQVCGRCGSQSRDCDPDGSWSIWWTICMEPQCCEGDVSTEACGDGGSRSRGCIGGVWDAWGPCSE